MMTVRLLPLMHLVLLLASPVVRAGSPAPFSKEAQGDWYVLAAHRGNKNIAANKWTGSRVSVTAECITWHNAEKPDTPLLEAICQRAKVVDTPKAKADPNELTTTVRGSLCPMQNVKLSARWKITENEVLIVWVQVAEFKGNRNGTYSGASQADVLLTCLRKPVPVALAPDPVKDVSRFVGKWAVLAEFDDANSARTRPQGHVEFTASDFFKRTSFNPKAKPEQQGSWKLLLPQGTRGRIDFHFKYGIEGNQGRSPSLYTFFGNDLLMVVYPEGGWTKEAVEKQESRQPPTHFGSDGNRNMWIMRRMSALTK